MHGIKLAVSICVLSLAVAGLAACGSSESDEAKIVSVVETSAASRDPADCEALSTLNFMEQTEHEEGQRAVKACEEDAEDTANDPKEVKVTAVKVNGPSASAHVAFVGGDSDGQTVSAGLIEEGGEWKLDKLIGFVVFNRGKLVAALRRGFEEPASGLTDAQAKCFGDGIEGLEDEEIESLLLSSTATPALSEIAQECAQ